MADGIVTALSRLVMVARLAVLIWFAWKYPNFIIWLIVLLSLPRIYSLFRKRTEEEQRYFEVRHAAVLMSVLYFGLIAVLLFGHARGTAGFEQYGFRSHGHGHDVIVQ